MSAPLISPEELADLLQQNRPTEEQSAIISAPLEPLLVIAGAGSGKTTTMADRVVWLVANGLVLPEEILGVTFTRKAAGELAARIRRQLAKLSRLARSGRADLAPAASAEESLEPKVSTYHSYASGIVADHGLRLGIERDAVVLGGAQSWQLASQVAEAYDGEYSHFAYAKSTLVSSVIQLAGECAEHLQDPNSVRGVLEQYAASLEALPYIEGKKSAPTQKVRDLLDVLRTRASVAAMVARYAEAKRTRNALDYGDLVALAAQLAMHVPQVGESERERYKVVLLDEFQDTSHAQLMLFSSLYGAGHPVTAVGDPNQSIYGFRGASAGQLFRFPELFPKADGTPAATAELTVAWRNSVNVLEAANTMSSVLNASAARKHKHSTVRVSPLRTRPEPEAGEVLLARYETAPREAEDIAEQIIRRSSFSGRSGGDEAHTVAVLCRRRAQFETLREAFEARDIPYEIVGLGGLLSTPEIVDLVSTLRVLADPGRSDALMRLLSGARWRLGAADLMAFADWSRYLARQRELPVPEPSSLAEPVETAAGTAAEVLAGNDDAIFEQDLVDSSSLVEALERLSADWWPPQLRRTLTAEGTDRLLRLRNELGHLRSFVSDDLTTLLGEVERTMLLDIEVAAKPGADLHQARRNLDAFQEAAAGFVQSADRVDLLAFLSWLEAAASEENGLEVTQVDVNEHAVQLLTVHASKGLEWDLVFVPGLNDGAFPAKSADRWSTGAAALPWPLRGDGADLPEWDLTAPDQKGWLDNEKLYAADVAAHAEEEERRLAYVAFTRARRTLICSSSAWVGGRAKAAEPSVFLQELVALAEQERPSAHLTHWAADETIGDQNPLVQEALTALWPYDPLEGPVDADGVPLRPARGRRRILEEAAARVRFEMAKAAGRAASGESRAESRTDWSREAELLLAKRMLDEDVPDVELPAHISASLLVELGHNPAAVTRQLRRPVPRRPGMAARKGTAFHSWVEEYFGTTGQLDLEEQPAADVFVDEAFGLDAMIASFKSSEWAHRAPAFIEVAIETRVGGVVVRGRIDAVFRDQDGTWDLIDWKTGAVPAGKDLADKSVQLALYRLAWARLKGEPLERVKAAFYYAGPGRLVRPHDLAGEAELEAIISDALS